MKSLLGIKSGLANSDETIAIAEKLYLSYSTEAFNNQEDIEFYIKKAISIEFMIPFTSIQVCGSSKTGISFFKEKLFLAGKSDLDIAIIYLPLFNSISENVNEITHGYTDLSKFSWYKGVRCDKIFKNNFAKGYINPIFMPNCIEKSEWLDFFNLLSNKYFHMFKNINGCVYSSEYFFNFKQQECIKLYLNNPNKYDQISGTVQGTN